MRCWLRMARADVVYLFTRFSLRPRIKHHRRYDQWCTVSISTPPLPHYHSPCLPTTHWCLPPPFPTVDGGGGRVTAARGGRAALPATRALAPVILPVINLLLEHGFHHTLPHFATAALLPPLHARGDDFSHPHHHVTCQIVAWRFVRWVVDW